MATVSGVASDEPDLDCSRGSLSHLRRSKRRAVSKVRAGRVTYQKVLSPIDDDDDDFTSPPMKKNPPQPAPKKTSKCGAKCGAADVGDVGYDNAEEGIKPENYATMRCSSGSVLEVITDMPESLKMKIDGCGFAKFLKFKIDEITNRALAMFTMSHIKDNPLRIEVRGKTLPLIPEAVHNVFSIPLGGNKFPSMSYKQMQDAKAELRRLCMEHGMQQMFDNQAAEKKDGVKKKGAEKTKLFSSYGSTDVSRWVIQNFASKKQDDEWTLQCFFMLVCNALLFPTSTPLISGSDYLRCKDVEAIRSFDWCTAVIDDIRDKAKKWKNSLGKNLQVPLQFKDQLHSSLFTI